ncbi:MAG: 30S ribosomal protein S20 [Lentisphaerae bacterium]|jgi:small subunit ribosomal protein S20|nr:30S ribosomal protein S20 [Victivallaceae bacterium]MDD3702895.1 30S ribosomal protein S20 [Victivallaceae bacterium]MDD5662849.1 30S ribosomal protein S20 [Victivallaceae bacterium]NLK83036.1 30S ribosomal protein S20 [Lentisphaerota bacterium]
MINKSAAKRDRNSKKAQLINRSRISALKTIEKRLRSAISSADSGAESVLREYCSKLDKVAKAGTIHRNKVANKKSQLTKLFNSAAK